jgi:putative transposase
MVELANEPRFASTPPARIVPALADEGVYVARPVSTACCATMAK